MIGAALAAWVSHWRRQPLQLGLLILGLALATGLWSAVQAINSEARASYDRAMDQLGVAGLSVLISPEGSIPLDRYVTLRRAGWKLAPVLEGRWRLKSDSIRLMGVDLLSHPALPGLAAAMENEGRDPLEALLPPGRLFVAPDVENDLPDDAGLPPVTVTDLIPSGTALADLSVAEELLNKPGQLTRLLILPGQVSGLRPLEELAPDLTRIPADDAAASTRLTDSFHLNLTAFGLLSFAVGLFIVHATIGLAFEQRRALVRTLRALGTPMHTVALVAIGELLLLALLSGILGMALGYTVAAALLPDVSATLRGLYGAPAPGALSLRPEWVLSGFAMTLAGVGLAGGQTVWRLARMPLLSAPGQMRWAGFATGTFRLQAVCGGLMILCGVLAVLVFDGLIAGFVLLGGLMLGSALCLPAILSQILRMTDRRGRSVLAEWLWADTRAQIPALSLALMALLLALATNIGVGTMVSSFRLTFVGWLDQRLASEMYVTARSDAQAYEITDWATDQGLRVLPIRWSETTLAGASVRIYGVADDETYRAHWPLIEAQPDVWDKVMSGQAALVNEQLARRHGYWPGETVALGPDWRLPVAGVYSDYGNPNGQVIVALETLLSVAPDIPYRQIGLRIENADVSSISKSLQSELNVDATQITAQNLVKQQSIAVFDTTFVVTGALNILTLGVAGFSMLTSLLTVWRLRQPQIAPVWALGVTRRDLSWIELGRSVMLALLTACLAIPLGLVMAWVLLSIVNVEAFGWRLPMFLFPMDWLRLTLLAVVAAICAAALPSIRLTRMNPNDLLRVFSNER